MADEIVEAPETGNQTETVTMEQLEAATNAEAGWVPQGTEPQAEAVTESQAPEAAPAEPKKQDAPAGQASATPSEISQTLSETPFKGEDVVRGVNELAKAWKEAQRTIQANSEEVKPWKQLLDYAKNRPDVAQTLRLLEQGIQNPELLRAYQTQHQADVRPDPLAYGDLYDPNNKARYDQELAAWEDRKIDSRISSRLSSVEQSQTQEKQKYEFKQRFPDVQDDADTMLNEARAESTRYNPYEVAYKLRNWDKREAQLTEKIRSEFKTKLESASRKTPEASSGADPKVSLTDVANHIVKYGSESTQKKYGQKVFLEAMKALS